MRHLLSWPLAWHANSMLSMNYDKSNLSEPVYFRQMTDVCFNMIKLPFTHINQCNWIQWISPRFFLPAPWWWDSASSSCTEGNHHSFPTMSAEVELEHHAELADLVAAMNVAGNRMTPPNGYRTGASRGPGAHKLRLSDRKMSLQERGSRIARQPTIETKRVSITGTDVRRLQSLSFLAVWLKRCVGEILCSFACRTLSSSTSTDWPMRLERSVWKSAGE